MSTSEYQEQMVGFKEPAQTTKDGRTVVKPYMAWGRVQNRLVDGERIPEKSLAVFELIGSNKEPERVGFYKGKGWTLLKYHVNADPDLRPIANTLAIEFGSRDAELTALRAEIDQLRLLDKRVADGLETKDANNNVVGGPAKPGNKGVTSPNAATTKAADDK